LLFCRRARVRETRILLSVYLCDEMMGNTDAQPTGRRQLLG